MISRRRFLMGVAIASAPIGVAAAAQEYKAQPGSGSTPRPGERLPRVGYLGSGYPADPISQTGE